MEKPTIYLPIQNLKNQFFRHAGDTFRETVGLWEQNGLVDVVMTDNGFVWLNEEETDEAILLYDRPTVEWWEKAPPQRYKLALFGNQIPGQQQIPRAFPWIFWGRRPRLLQKYEGNPLPGYHERPIQSIFLGKIENQVQQHFRNPALYKDVIEEFHLVVGGKTKYPYSQQEYLDQLTKAKFGLCLRGYGPKCNREIELMALGTVPLVTPDVDMLGYFDPPREHVHYLKVDKPEDIRDLLANVTEQEWTAMSKNCVDWYMRNCSCVGSFYTTMRLVNTLSTAQFNPAGPSPVRMAQSIPLMKLPNTKRVLIDTVFFERPFSGISRVWINLLEELSTHIPSTMLLGSDRFEIVLLLRANASVPPYLVQRFSFFGIPTLSYTTADGDVEVLNRVCEKLQADLFISTYYTYATNRPCLAIIHDMIPERFRMKKDAMWYQKDRCLANAKWFMCVSEATKRDLLQYCKNATEANTVTVHNSFNIRVFQGVDQELHNGELAKRAIKAELDIETPFVLIIASNTNNYKNLRLVLDMIRMKADYFKSPTGMGLVLLTNNGAFKPALPENVKFKVISGIKDRQLGLLYGLASALVYPSRYEGFGLPVLEAFWSECPVICCKNSGSIPEIGGEGCFYVDPNNPGELFKVLLDVTSGAIESVVREKAALGITQLDKFTPLAQLQQFKQCVRGALAGNLSASKTPHKVSAPLEYLKTRLDMSAPATQENKTTVQKAEDQKEKSFDGIQVLVQYFIADDADRQAEYDFCVQANLANENVAKMHCLLEPNTTAPDWLATHPKYVEFRVPGRLTYKEAFEYANANLSGEICALMNLDIFLDHNSDWRGTAFTVEPSSGKLTDGLLDMGVVLCLSRHEFDGVGASTKDEQLQKLAYANAQDCWIFRSPVFVQECDFKMGMLGCDNAIAHRFKISGYIPVNSPNEFKIHHYDVCRGKAGGNYL